MSNSSTAVQLVSSESRTSSIRKNRVTDIQKSSLTIRERMNPDAVALTKRPDQLCVLGDLVRLQPLFELVDHDEQLPVVPSPWPRRIAASSSERDNSVESPWHFAATAAASRRSVSADVASTNTETTESR